MPLTSLSMMDWLSALSWAQVAAFGCVALVLAVRGLLPSYRWFAIYLTSEVVLTAASYFIRSLGDRNLYGLFYFASVPVILGCVVMAAIEVFGKVMQKRRGIARLGQQLLAVSPFVAAVASLGTVWMRVGHGSSSAFEVLYGGQRFLDFGIMIYWILLLAFLAWFPVSLSRNALWHCVLFTLYFLARAGTSLLLGHVHKPWADGVGMGTALCCAVGWIVAMTKAGEMVKVRPGHTWNPAEGARLLARLDEINEHLMSTSRVR